MHIDETFCTMMERFAGVGRGDGGYCTTLDRPVRLWSRWQQVNFGQRVLRIDGKYCMIIEGSAYE